MQVAGRAEVAENVVENPVRELGIAGAIAEDAAEQADQGMHHLTADKRQRVNQHDIPVQPGGLDGRRQPGDSCSHDAYIGVNLVRELSRRPGDLGQSELGQGVRH